MAHTLEADAREEATLPVFDGVLERISINHQHSEAMLVAQVLKKLCHIELFADIGVIWHESRQIVSDKVCVY